MATFQRLSWCPIQLMAPLLIPLVATRKKVTAVALSALERVNGADAKPVGDVRAEPVAKFFEGGDHADRYLGRKVCQQVAHAVFDPFGLRTVDPRGTARWPCGLAACYVGPGSPTTWAAAWNAECRR